MTRLFTRALCASACGGLAAIANAQSVYSHGFEDGLAPGFDVSSIDVTPLGGRHFLGQFGNDSATLTLSGLTPGLYHIDFDFYGIGTWDGNQAPGPDWFILEQGELGELLRTTFAIGSEDTRVGIQAYPGVGTDSNLLGWPGRTNAVENNTLGYLYAGIYQRDAVWRLGADFMVDSPTTQLVFRGEGLQSLRDESWGIDNIDVRRVVVPSPGALALAGAAAAFTGRRRRPAPR